MSALSALAGIITGGVTVLLWILFGLSSIVYELLPAFLLSSFVIWLVNRYNNMLKRMSQEPNLSVIDDEFNKMKDRQNQL